MLNNTFSLGYEAFTNAPGDPDILWITGLGSQFTCISGNLTLNFTNAGTAGVFSSSAIGMEILLGTSKDLAPVTVDSSINTAGHVTLDWSTPSANTTLIEVERSDNGGDTWSTIYTSSSMTSSTYTDTSGDHVNSIYKVNQVEFGWLDVPTTHIPTANPTLTINLNDSTDLAGVRFEIDESDSSLMNILVDDEVTATINWGRIGELIVNGTSDNDDLTISGDLFAALTFHNNDGDDSLTFSGGNWGEWGSPVEWDGDNPINVTAIDGAWLTLDVETELADLFIGEDSAVTSDLTGEDILTVAGELTLDENAMLFMLGGEFNHSATGSADTDSTIQLSGEATASLGQSDTFTNNGNIIVADATLNLGQHFVNNSYLDIASEAIVNADEELETIGGYVSVYGPEALNMAEAIITGYVNWYSSEVSALPALDTSASLYFMEDVDLSDMTFTSGCYYLAEGVMATVDGNLDLDGGSMSFYGNTALYVTGGTFTISGGSTYVSAGGLIDISDADVVLEDGGYLWGYGGVQLTNSTVTVNTSMGAGNGLIWNINDGSLLDIFTTFENRGQLVVNSGGQVKVETGATLFNGNFDSSSIITIDGGTLTNLGTISWQTSDLSGIDAIDNQGVIVFNYEVDIGGLTLGIGHFRIASGVSVYANDDLTLNGTATLEIESSAYFYIGGTATVTLGNDSENAGQIIVGSDAILAVGTSVTLTNYGEIDLPTGHDDSFIDNQGSGFVAFV